jgi:hypothetical protein
MYIVIQDLESNLQLHELKRQLQLIPFLKSNNIQITNHEWDNDTWNTQTIGFLPVYLPKHCTKEYVYDCMIGKLNSADTLDFRIKHMWLVQEVMAKKIRVPVYAIEICNNEYVKANKLF